MPVGDRPQQANAAPTAAALAHHVGGGPGLVDEDQAIGVQLGLECHPMRPRGSDIGTLLLARVERLFLSVSPSRDRVFHIPPLLEATLCSASNQRRSSSSVASGWAATCAAIAA